MTSDTTPFREKTLPRQSAGPPRFSENPQRLPGFPTISRQQEVWNPFGTEHK